MPSLTHSLFTLFALATLSTQAYGKVWASFCNDDNCSEGCGLNVDVGNHGCLNQNGRRSVRITNPFTADIKYNLVASPGPGCPCQNYCENDIEGNGGLRLDGGPDGNTACFTLRDEAAQSFRFVTDQFCDADQC